MPQFVYVCSLGDAKPIVLNNVVSSTGSAIASATITLLDNVTGAIVAAAAAMTVAGSSIASGNYAWAALGAFLAQIKVTFTDGIIDNSITVVINVVPVPV